MVVVVAAAASDLEPCIACVPAITSNCCSFAQSSWCSATTSVVTVLRRQGFGAGAWLSHAAVILHSRLTPSWPACLVKVLVLRCKRLHDELPCVHISWQLPLLIRQALHADVACFAAALCPRSTPGGWQQRSEGGLGTPRAAAAAAAAAAAPPRGITHPGAL
jgi:hypothetical protein